MTSIEEHLDRLLAVLRATISRKGLTQVEIQEAYGWGISYISQLLTKQKRVRIDHVVKILNVVGVEPAEFFAEVFPAPGRPQPPPPPPDPESVPRLGREELERLRSLVEGLALVLEQKKLLTGAELSEAVQAAERELELGG